MSKFDEHNNSWIMPSPQRIFGKYQVFSNPRICFIPGQNAVSWMQTRSIKTCFRYRKQRSRSVNKRISAKISYILDGVRPATLPPKPQTSLLCSLASCSEQGHQVSAYELLDEMLVPDYKSCNTMIKNYTTDHQYLKALSVFKWMQNARLRPDSFALAAVVKSSGAIHDAGLGATLHAFAVRGGFLTFVAVEKALMDMYARFDMLSESCQVFREMRWRDSVAWNVLLSGYARARLYGDAMDLFHAMGDEEVKPTAVTMAVILPICAKLKILKAGQSVHAFVIKMGLDSDTLVGNALISMYAKCGSIINDAFRTFCLIAWKDVISWNSMIAGYCDGSFFGEAFELFCRMLLSGWQPNYATVANILPICASVEDGWCYGRELHCYALRCGLEVELAVCNALLTHYSKVGDMKAVESIFKQMHSRDLVTWNTVIAGYALNGWLSRAINLFHELLSSEIKPDSITLIGVLPVCAQLNDVREGKKIHGYILRHLLLCQEASTGNALISFYGKCGELDNALKTFKGIPERDLISWNAMLSAYADNEQWEKFVDLLNQMNLKGIQPDPVTTLSVLQVSAFYGIKKVREAHAYSLRAGFTSQMTVGNAILDAYAKCGSTDDAFRMFRSLTGRNVITGNTMISGYLKHGCREDAEMIFGQMCERDVTTWNLMIQVYAQNDCIDRAFGLFHELQHERMKPDNVGMMSILAACARLASVHLVRQCHGYIIRASLGDDHLEGALLDSYAKCGSINDAYKLFRTSYQKDLVTYTAMLGGYAMHGMAQEALGVYSQMVELDIKLDHVIITSLLSACSHAGLVDEGWKLFKSISKNHGIEPTMEHYACMVDLLARRGRFREAYDFIKDMPCEANGNLWGTLLGACKTYGEVEVGRLVADHLFDVDTGNIGNYVVMSNIYAADGRWDGVEQVRRLMKAKDLKKPAGCSWIEVERMRHVFVAGDLSHPLRLIIRSTLRTLDRQIKDPLGQSK
ncbi:putative pentatricopeptide repeat-containing protein At5g08490 [Phoenix dactylifera]|uniref:Pentatricopeptide repeat-containing protein At5g08490 n=1 Tax=Phoenix dactylifera TaxID=42345 RepID=A0A8B7CAT5_PHODC|nr:putative pentatricopeptide repeat-containing protein At5g08490 [Phoenix dactylifera]